MKRITVAVIAMLICIASFSQSKPNVKDTLPKTTAPAAPLITDSTALFSIKDLQDLDNLIQSKFTISQAPIYNDIYKWIQDRLNQKAKQYIDKNTPTTGKNK